MTNYEYKIATRNNDKPFGAWLNSVTIDGWKLHMHIPTEGYIFQREKIAPKPAPKPRKKKSDVEKPTE